MNTNSKITKDNTLWNDYAITAYKITDLLPIYKDKKWTKDEYIMYEVSRFFVQFNIFYSKALEIPEATTNECIFRAFLMCVSHRWYKVWEQYINKYIVLRVANEYPDNRAFDFFLKMSTYFTGDDWKTKWLDLIHCEDNHE